MQLLPYIENERHVAEVELALLLVELLQLGGVVVLALLCHVRSHVGLLLGLEAASTRRTAQPPASSRLEWLAGNGTGQCASLTFSTSAFVALMSWSVFSAYCAARSASLHSLSKRFLLWWTRGMTGRVDPFLFLNFTSFTLRKSC